MGVVRIMLDLLEVFVAEYLFVNYFITSVFLAPKAEERAKKLAAKKARDLGSIHSSVMYKSQMGIMRPNWDGVGAFQVHDQDAFRK